MAAPPLPSASPVSLGQNILLQPPLSRCGRGPGLIIIRPYSYAECQAKNTSLDPEPVQKWAEESYAVVQITLEHEMSADGGGVLGLVERGIAAFESSNECEKDRFAMLIYGSPADYAPGFGKILGNVITALNRKLAAAVFFSSWDMSEESIPILSHIPGNFQPTGPAKKDNHTVYSYADVSSAGFIVPGHADFKITSAGVAHTRSLTFLKKHLNGPYFDLEKIWEEHTWYEFGDRSVEKTMATMVQEPYVNHIPTMTGGIGRARLSKFYLENFIFNNPTDTALELISRTVGTDRIVDEFIFSLTHNKEIDWLLPGIPPTGKQLRIPFTSVVNIRGDRLYHEHIAWDQATVLVQLGLMPEYLPYPYALPGGQLPGPGKRFEYRVPAAGVETAMKLQDEHAVPSNGMFEFKVREVDDE
ncbi:LEA domain protein [Aspergillus flavus]|nr:LEA domain protein [Aspergillus flavus]